MVLKVWAALWVAAVLWLALSSSGCFGWAGLLASESLGWLRCIPLWLVLVDVAVQMAVAQMLKLHLNVSVAVVSEANSSFPLPNFECCLEVSQPCF